MGSYGSLDEFDRKSRNGIEASLFDGEQFLGAIDCMDSLIPRRRTRLILTDQRIIAFERGFIQQSVTDYNREKLSSISFDKGLVNRKITLEGSGISEEFLVDISDGRQFATAARNNRAKRVFEPDQNTTAHHQNTATSVQSQESSQPDTETVDLLDAGSMKRVMQQMDNYDFEYFVADLWERMGWTTVVSQASVDAGIDVTATKETPYPQKKLIQAKRYGENTSVGGPDIQQYASLKHQEADTDSVVVVTSSYFTKSAESRADELNVKLVDGDQLVEMIQNLNAQNLLTKYGDIALKSKLRQEPVTTSDPNSTQQTMSTGGLEEAAESTSSEQASHSNNSDSAHRETLKPALIQAGRVGKKRVADPVFQKARQKISTRTTDRMDSAPTETSELTGELNDRWHQGVQAGIGLWIVVFALTGIIPSNSPLGPAIGLGVLGAIFLLPVALYFDAKQVSRETQWNPNSWVYSILGFIWFLNIPVGLYYLYHRRNADLIADTTPTSVTIEPN